jgi:hypothetical protein
MLTGMTLVKLMGDLVGLLEVAVEVVAQAPRGHTIMKLGVAEAGAGAEAVETFVLAAARVTALLLAVGMKRLLLFQDLLNLTWGMQSTKALQDLTLGMTM